MKSNVSPFILPLIILGACAGNTSDTPQTALDPKGLPRIEGKTDYLHSPFLTAGDRVYMVGFQDGTFPDLGWHIEGEMGGIWDHPIKLLDGFAASVHEKNSNESFCLNNALKFVNFPMANVHYFDWPEQKLEFERFQFVPDSIEGIIVQYKIVNHDSETRNITFSFTALSDLRPTWLGERTNMIDTEDVMSFDSKSSAVLAKDKNNPWYVMFGSELSATFSPAEDSCYALTPKGLGKKGTLVFDVHIPPNGSITIPFFIAGSYQSEAGVRTTFELLKSRKAQLLTKKIQRYEAFSKNSHITIPDTAIAQMYEWLHYNVDWLVRDVPEHGTGLSAGLPDYPWWFGADATYSLQGALAMGDHELAKQTIMLLHKISKRTNSNGRIVHEVSTNGSVYHPGNLNETAQFASLILNYYKWTGDTDLVRELFPDLKKGMDWLMADKDPDGDHFPNGSGMMEIPGLESQLEMIDVAAYTQQALESMAVLANAVGETSLAATYQTQSDNLKLNINKEWWDADEQSFGDFRATVKDAKPIIDAALVRSDTMKKYDVVTRLRMKSTHMSKIKSTHLLPHVVYSNWVVNTPLETGAADLAKALAALKTAKKYENAFGMFVTGIDRTLEPDSVVLNSRKKTFSYAGAVMTLPTGVMAVAASRYGEADQALEYLHKLNRSFSYSLPGSMYEVSPDFGMMAQAWNIYGVAVPIVVHLFGIQPLAYDKTIGISPNVPSTWKHVAIENVIVGDNVMSLSINKTSEAFDELHITQSQGGWKLLLSVHSAKKVVVDGHEVSLKEIKDNTIVLKGTDTTVRIYR